MLDHNILHQIGRRKYLLVSGRILLLLKSYGKHQEMSLESVTDRFLTKGLKLANELYMKKVIDDSLNPRSDGLRYMISRQDKKYLVVTPEIHEKVIEFARKRKIKLIEATRCLIGLGMLAYFQKDPRGSQLYKSNMEILRLITEEWQKKHPGQSIDQVFGPGYWEKMEASILRDIGFPGKKRVTAKEKERSEPVAISSNRDSDLKGLLRLGLIFGGGWLLADYVKLKKENEELHRIITGKITSDNKHDQPANAPKTEGCQENPIAKYPGISRDR